MSTSRVDISAYLDGEMSPVVCDRLRREIGEHDELARESTRLKEVRRRLREDRGTVLEEDILEAQARIGTRLEQSTRGLRIRKPLWESDVRVPVPIAAAATVAFLMMTAMFVLQSNRTMRPEAGSIASGEGTVNVQVNVDGEDTDALLAWLNKQETLNNVTIQLPEQAEFALRGAPVLMRRNETGDGYSPVPPLHTSDRNDEWQIVPLEEGAR